MNGLDFPSQAEIGLRVVLAAVLGGLVGLEREVRDHPAGLRTHVSVALGAALFGIVSGYGFGAFDASRAETNFQVDPTRVASNIVTGVGFLGGGAIVKYGASVRGLTTAASLWVTAAIGLGCALGVYFATLVTTGALLASLVGLRRPARWFERRLAYQRETVVIRVAPGADPAKVVAALGSIAGVSIASLSIREDDEGCRVSADVSASRGQPLEVLLAPLAALEEVGDIDVS